MPYRYVSAAATIAANAARHRERAAAHTKAGRPDHAAGSLRKVEKNRFLAAQMAAATGEAFGPPDRARQILQPFLDRMQAEMVGAILHG